MIDIKLTQQQAKCLEDAVEAHMYFCQADLSGMDEVPEDWSPFAPYCGCSTCESREYLMATFDWLRKNDVVDVYVDDDTEEYLEGGDDEEF